MDQKTLDQLAEAFKTTEEVIYFEPLGDTDSAVKFKEFVVSHGHDIDRETAALILCRPGRDSVVLVLDFDPIEQSKTPN